MSPEKLKLSDVFLLVWFGFGV